MDEQTMHSQLFREFPREEEEAQEERENEMCETGGAVEKAAGYFTPLFFITSDLHANVSFLSHFLTDSLFLFIPFFLSPSLSPVFLMHSSSAPPFPSPCYRLLLC